MTVMLMPNSVVTFMVRSGAGGAPGHPGHARTPIVTNETSRTMPGIARSREHAAGPGPDAVSPPTPAYPAAIGSMWPYIRPPKTPRSMACSHEPP